MTTSKLPKDWRKRRGLPPRSARFTIEPVCAHGDPGYNLVDWAYTSLVNHTHRYLAEDDKRLARAYVKRWGDIDLGTFPYDVDDELNYDDPEYIDQWWVDHP